MITSNSGALVGRSIRDDRLREINRELEGDIMVRQVGSLICLEIRQLVFPYEEKLKVLAPGYRSGALSFVVIGLDLIWALTQIFSFTFSSILKIMLQVYDVKGIDMGNGLVRYKAEIDFDGRELARSYLIRQNLPALLEEVRNNRFCTLVLQVHVLYCAGEACHHRAGTRGLPPQARGADSGLPRRRGRQDREEP